MTWTNKTIGDWADVIGGGTPSTRATEFWGGDIPWFTPGEIPESGAGIVRNSNRLITKAGLARSAAKMLPVGSVLVTSRASIGNCAIAGVPMATNQGFTSLVPKDSRSSLFLYYWVQQNRHQFLSRSAGSTFLEISVSKVRDIEISSPGLPEQAAIGEAIADADHLITTLERLIAKKQAIKQGMMQQLLTGRTRLPGFTSEWTDIRLGDHVSYVKTVALSRAQLDAKSPLKYLHYGDIHTRSSVLLDAVAEEMPRASAFLAGRAGQLRCGDLVFADASEDPAGVGKSVEIVDVPSGGVVPGLHTIAARFDKSVLADGFKAYLQFIPSFREQLLRLAAGTKVLATTRSYISSVILALPDVTEQKAIADVLHDSEREIDALRVRLSKARDMKTGMMQQLLTGRTRLQVEAVS
ncbi:hypothetical protein DQ226_16015 [Dietzia maris]|uniref:Type I restriction modification DNA specificity domain-containing protein n=1 Tax=Dietzia maris TaxID=37915 RepID=A0A365P6V6_9ACTN|nr:hypothetical protein DQ226_16015 [Dietzia maris]